MIYPLIINFGAGEMFIGAAKRDEDECLTAISIGMLERAQRIGSQTERDNTRTPLLVLHFDNAASARVLQKWANRIVEELTVRELEQTAEAIKDAAQDVAQIKFDQPNA